MPKSVVFDETSLRTLATLVAEAVCATLRPPAPAVTETEGWRAILDLRISALHAALQVAHEPSQVVETAQRFFAFLQQGN